MPATSWSEAVISAVRRHVQRTGSTLFTRQGLIDSEMPTIVAATGSAGTTPWQTLSRELQELRDQGLLEFVGSGVYRYAGLQVPDTQFGATKGIFVTGEHSIYGDVSKDFYRFPANYLPAARRMVGQWIIYLERETRGRPWLFRGCTGREDRT